MSPGFRSGYAERRRTRCSDPSSTLRTRWMVTVLHNGMEQTLTKTLGLCLLILTTLFFSCRREATTSSATETIAPATPPQVGTDTDSVSTQTMEIGGERSPNEGGVLTDPDQASPSPSPNATPST